MKLFKHTLLAVSLAAACSGAIAAGEAKNVIFFLGDGMGPVTVTASRIYKYGEAGKLNMEQLTRSARIKTYSNDAQTTDSAPSMAAYTTGIKMNNEVLASTPDTKANNSSNAAYVSGSNTLCPATGNGSSVPTILEMAKAAGKAVGAVTTARVTHATPAATYSHICHRDGENNIAAQMVPTCDNTKCVDSAVSPLSAATRFNTALTKGTDVGLDVLLGGGLRHYLPKGAAGASRTDTTNLLNELQTSGYTVIAPVDSITAPTTSTTSAQKQAATAAFRAVNAATTNKLVGFFTRSHMSYELDRVTAEEPSLAEMSTKAVDILSKNSNGFYLMVEGGRIDHALHDTSAKRALVDTIAFDDAIKAVLAQMEAKDPGLKNTLILVTADHDHTMAFNGYGKRTGATTATQAGVLGLVKNVITGQPDPDVRGSATAKPYPILVFGNGGTGAPPEGGASTCTATGKGGPGGAVSCAPVRGVDRPVLTDADTSSDNYHQPVNVPFAGTGSETHGGGDVTLFGKGAGVGLVKGTMDNTKVFNIQKQAFGF